MAIKIVIATLLLLLPIAGLSLAAQQKFGRDISLSELTKISAIAADPQKYLGQKVLVEGMIVEVCAKRGCWVDIASDKEYEKIQIKVTDGEIIFPMSARGHMAKVEGVVDEVALSREKAIAWHRHAAEEKGIEFDPATVTGPEIIYRIIGQGAVIED